jgi:hypothetical protein
MFIQILNPNKATGPDKISHKMLKISPEKIAKPLLIIFNKALQQSKYPFVPLIYLHNLLKISGDNWRVWMCHLF